MSQTGNNSADWALYNACADCDLGAIREAIEQGADPCFADYFLWTSLHWVASNGQGDAFLLLLRNAKTLTPKDKYGKTPLASSKGCVRTMLTVGEKWSPRDPLWRTMAPQAQYKLKTARKWTTGRVAHIDSAAAVVNLYIHGKTTPAVSLNLSDITACHVLAKDGEFQLSVANGRHSVVHCIRPGDDAFGVWAGTLAALLGAKMQGDPVPQPPPPSQSASASASAAASSPSNGVAKHATLANGAPPPQQARGAIDTASARAPPQSARAPTVAVDADAVVEGGVRRGAPTAGPNGDVGSIGDVGAAAAAAEGDGDDDSGRVVLESSVGGSQTEVDLERRVMQLEQENYILIQQVKAQEKKIEMQTKSLHRENEALRQEIETQTKKFADQAISILDMGAKLAAEIEERRRLAATLSSLHGGGGNHV